MKKITKLEEIDEIQMKEDNIIYIYGKIGSGKTYLSKKIMKKNNKKFLYTNFNEIIQNIANRENINMVEKDAIVIDGGIEQTKGKKATSGILKELLQDIKKENKNIIVVSEMLPDEIKKLKTPLSEFILSGETIELCYNEESRIKIAEKYAVKYEDEMNKEVNRLIVQDIAKEEEDLGKIKGKINRMSIAY